MDANAKVTLVGAGLLGHALALVHAAGGHQVKMQDISEKQLEVGVGLIESALSTMVDAGAITAAEKAATLSRTAPVSCPCRYKAPPSRPSRGHPSSDPAPGPQDQ